MKYKLICCEIFLREVSLLISKSKNMIDPVFLPKGAHENSDGLRALIQAEIDNIDLEKGYEAVILGYGLCGNVAEGLTARLVPLVIPRMHDCCSILLGSGAKFVELFGDNLSQRWTSAGYMERGKSGFRDRDEGKALGLDKEFHEFVEQYGEENAQFIWDTIHPKIEEKKLVYIEVPETAHLGYCEKAREIALKEGKELLVLDGTLEVLQELIDGEWGVNMTGAESGIVSKFLVVQPGETVRAVYDYEEVITASKKVETNK